MFLTSANMINHVGLSHVAFHPINACKASLGVLGMIAA